MAEKTTDDILKGITAELDEEPSSTQVTSQESLAEKLDKLTERLEQANQANSRLREDVDSIRSQNREIVKIVERLHNRLTMLSGEVRPHSHVMTIGTQTQSPPSYRDVVTRSGDSRSASSHSRGHVNNVNQPRSASRAGLLSAKECMSSIDLFFGNTDKKSQVVDANELIKFNAWFDTACSKLQAAGLPVPQQIAAIRQRLQGPILRAYMLHMQQHPQEPTSLHMLKNQLRELFANSAVFFSQHSRTSY